MGNILNNPDVQNQLWTLVGIGVVWLLGQAVSWVKGQLTDSQKDLVARAEHYAEEAGAWAIVHFPGLNLKDLEQHGTDKLRDILRNQGVAIPDEVWTHLVQVMEGFIAKQLAARHTTVAPPLTVSEATRMATGELPKAAP